MWSTKQALQNPCRWLSALEPMWSSCCICYHIKSAFQALCWSYHIFLVLKGVLRWSNDFCVSLILPRDKYSLKSITSPYFGPCIWTSQCPIKSRANNTHRSLIKGPHIWPYHNSCKPPIRWLRQMKERQTTKTLWFNIKIKGVQSNSFKHGISSKKTETKVIAGRRHRLASLDWTTMINLVNHCW